MLNILTIVLLLTCVSLSNTNKLFNEITEYQEDIEFKSNFAYDVVKNVYRNFQQWFFTIIFCDFAYFENRILKYTETYGYGHPVMLLEGCPYEIKGKAKPRLTRHGATAYIVTSNQLSIDVNDGVLLALKSTGVWKPQTVVIFVISSPVKIDSYFNFDMKNHFALIWTKRITKSILILWSDRMRIYMFNRYLNKVIEVTEAPNISNLLDEQYYNLYGYQLRLSVFRKIYVDEKSGPVSCDSRLTQTVMEYFNATCLPLLPRDGQTVGDLFNNGTATGITADLIDGYSDLELNSRILKNSFYGYIDNTYPLSQDNLCFIVRKSGRQSSFMTAIKLITTTVLSILLFNVVLFIFIALVVRRREISIMELEDRRNTGAVVLKLFKCFMRQTVDIKFPGHVFRAIVLMIILYSLVIGCAIDGIVTSAITYPRFKEDIKHVSQLFDTNLTLAVHNRHLEIFKKSLNPNFLKKMEPKIENFNDYRIREVFSKKWSHYAVLMRESYAKEICKTISNMEDGIPLYHVMQECPVPCSIVYGLRYGSPYLPRLSTLLSYLNQAGILSYWSRTEEYVGYQRYKGLYVSNRTERKPLTMDNIREVFYVWLAGLLISALSFLIECMLSFLKTFINRVLYS